MKYSAFLYVCLCLVLTRCQLKTTQTLDPSFGEDGKLTIDFDGGQDGATHVLELSNKSLLVVGNTLHDSKTDFAIARITESGSLDGSYGTEGKVTVDFFGGTDEAVDAVETADGFTLVGGHTKSSTLTQAALVKLDTQGELDLTFGSQGKKVLNLNCDEYTMAALHLVNSRPLGVGTCRIGAESYPLIFKLNEKGSLDSSFGDAGAVNLKTSLKNVRIQTSFKEANTLYIGGESADALGKTSFFVARLFFITGQWDLSWNSNGYLAFLGRSGGNGKTWGITSNDRGIFMVGSEQPSSGSYLSVWKLLKDGTFDTLFANQGNLLNQALEQRGTVVATTGRSLIKMSSGFMIAAGTALRDSSDFYALTFTQQGQLVSHTSVDFNQGNDTLEKAVPVAQGKVILLGRTASGTHQDFALARLSK